MSIRRFLILPVFALAMITAYPAQAEEAQTPEQTIAQEKKVLEGQRPVSDQELAQLKDKMKTILGPFQLDHVLKGDVEKASMSSHLAFGNVKVQSFSEKNESNQTVSVKTVWDVQKDQLENIGVWIKEGELTTLDEYEGNVGKHTLSLMSVTDDENAKDLGGFSRVVLNEGNTEKEYMLNGGHWEVTVYEK